MVLRILRERLVGLTATILSSFVLAGVVARARGFALIKTFSLHG